jgi:hypothetical protein
MIVINILKSLSFLSRKNINISNEKWRNSMIGFITIVINI